MKSPAFQLYAGDFFVDTITWDLDELGLYTRLLFIEWTNGPLPSDPKRLAKIAGTSLKKFNYLFEMVSPKFIQNGEGFLINERLEETRQAQKQFIENQREKGKKRASERWAGHIATVTKRLQPEGKPEHSSSSSSSSSVEDKTIKAPEPFRLPSPDEIENGSKSHLIRNIEAVAQELYEKKIWPRVMPFKNMMLKKGCNERAVLHSLTRILLKSPPPDEPWAYCCAIMKKEDGNFNARDYEKNQG